MLSPAPLRVCCLAVMAPALTKADRREDCLPVVLPFCVQDSKLGNEFGVAKFPGLLKRRAWLRTCMRNGSDPGDRSPKSFFSARTEGKPWHSVTLAVADKVRLKYTMSKGSGSFRNMGLAKANTGLHGMRRINRFVPLSHKDRKNPSSLTQESGESSPELPDSTSSEPESPFSLLRIVRSGKQEEVTSSSTDLITSSNCDVSKDISVSDRDPVVANVSNHREHTVSLNDKDAPPAVASSPPSRSAAPDQSQSTDLSVPITNCLSSALPNACEPSPGVQISAEEATDSTLLTGSSEVPTSTLVTSGKVDSADAECGDEPSLEFSRVSPPLSPASALDSDFDDSHHGSCSSSTLTADCSPLPSSLDEGNDSVLVAFPNATADSLSVDVTFSDVSCLTPKSPLDPEPSSTEMRRKTCCPLGTKDFSTYRETFLELERNLSKVLIETENLMRRCFLDHTSSQLRGLVRYLQVQSAVPCQRQSRTFSARSPRDVVDMKAELLQGADVKNLSTSALVSLVRKLESGASPDDFLPKNSPQGMSLGEGPSVAPAFMTEDCWDVAETSEDLLTRTKHLLRGADPELTESSDDDDSDLEAGQLEENSVLKRALWKFLKERASLTSRSTWLIARIHELENQLRTVTGILKKLSSVGELSFEGQAALSSESSTLPAAEADSVSAAPKPSKQKGLGRTVNGCIDPDSLNIQLCSDSDSGATCSRSRALDCSSFQKRKLLTTSGLHLTNSKVAKLSTVGCACNCVEGVMPCVLCTGRYNCVQGVDPDSLPLYERIALLDRSFHPLLSFQKDVPLLVHFENILKKNESQYQVVRPVSPTPSYQECSYWTKSRHYSDSKSRRKLNKFARSLLSKKYRNKKHFRKHKLVFGKWRKLHNRRSFHARNRIHRYSVASSGSSPDSPVASPLSAYDDGSGHDTKRKRDDNQFDIDNVIIPYSSKRGRLVKFEFKDIEIPSWRSKAFGNLQSIEMEEDTSDAAYIKRHDHYEIEERKIIRNGGGALCFFNTWQKRARRHLRSDSRAESSGANTPDPSCDQDNSMFQDSSNQDATSPLSPPVGLLASDDSQPLGHPAKLERRMKRVDETSGLRLSSTEADEVAPYERLVFPLPDETVDELVAESDHIRDDDATISGASCPASPRSTTPTTSTSFEDDEIADPEWTVVRRGDGGPEQPLVLKFAKR